MEQTKHMLWVLKIELLTQRLSPPPILNAFQVLGIGLVGNQFQFLIVFDWKGDEGRNKRSGTVFINFIFDLRVSG